MPTHEIPVEAPALITMNKTDLVGVSGKGVAFIAYHASPVLIFNLSRIPFLYLSSRKKRLLTVDVEPLGVRSSAELSDWLDRAVIHAPEPVGRIAVKTSITDLVSEAARLHLPLEAESIEENFGGGQSFPLTGIFPAVIVSTFGLTESDDQFLNVLQGALGEMPSPELLLSGECSISRPRFVFPDREPRPRKAQTD